ncbi:MAG: S41 family peptidase [Acidobacteriota bacterium]
MDKALDSIGEDSLEGLILDLRDNPGGALSQALAVSDRFLDKGEKIVATLVRPSLHASGPARYDRERLFSPFASAAYMDGGGLPALGRKAVAKWWLALDVPPHKVNTRLEGATDSRAHDPEAAGGGFRKR